MSIFRYSFALVGAVTVALAILAGCSSTAVSPFTYKHETSEQIQLEMNDFQSATTRQVEAIQVDITGKQTLTTRAVAQIEQEKNAVQQLLDGISAANQNLSGTTSAGAVSLIGLAGSALLLDNRRKDRTIAVNKLKRHVASVTGKSARTPSTSPSATATPTSPTMTAVHFNLMFGMVVGGQECYVVGSSAPLGHWDPKRAVKLYPNPAPKWSAEVQLNSGEPVAYKYIRLDGNGNVIWENGVDRTFTPAGPSMVLSDQWRS